MKNLAEREYNRILRHRRIRRKMAGTAIQPRLCVHRSLKNLTAQVIDDSSGKILLGLSTLSKNVRDKVKKIGGNVESATIFGGIFAAEAQKKGIKKVCFDRCGVVYHGRIKAFADAARAAGMEF